MTENACGYAPDWVTDLARRLEPDDPRATREALRASTKTLGLALRAGVHTGEVEVRGDDLGSLAVSIAKRVCDLAEPGEVLVSETARSHLVGSGLEFQDRGEHQSKGVPGT